MMRLVVLVLLIGLSTMASGLTIMQSFPTPEEQQIIPVTPLNAVEHLGMNIDILEDGSLIAVSVKLEALFYEKTKGCDTNLTVTVLPASKDEIVFGTTLYIEKKNNFLQFSFGKDYRFKLILPIKQGCTNLGPGIYTIEISDDLL